MHDYQFGAGVDYWLPGLLVAFDRSIMPGAIVTGTLEPSCLRNWK